jgi:penicillin-insensitive murein endopeptidase
VRKRSLSRLALPLAALLLAAAGPATPAPGPLRIIGIASRGCIQGAVRLPDEAVGMQTIRDDKSSFWGAPSTIAALELLAREAHAAGMPDLYMGDISAPRGGPLAGGHVSHQMGLDADVYLDLTPHKVLSVAARENLEPPSLVRPDGRAVDPARWRPEHVALLKLATELPGVDRVLVNPAIKRQLCRTVTSDRTWLRKIRLSPWPVRVPGPADAAARRRLRRLAAMVVRPARPPRPAGAQAPAAPAPCPARRLPRHHGGARMRPVGAITHSSDQSADRDRARGWWGGRAPNQDLVPTRVDPSFMGQHQGRLV